jgi:hypothetical protein
MLIYSVTNKIDGKVYIGATTLDLDDRKAEHFKKFRNKSRNHLFYQALHEFGWDNFTWDVVKYYDKRDDLMLAEKWFIAKYKSNNPEYGYNITDGGDGVIYDGNRVSFEVLTPSGDVIIVRGWKQFCRDNDLNEGSLHNTLYPYERKYTKKDGSISIYTTVCSHHRGFKLLGRFNDYPGGEYTQASGNGAHPESLQDDDIV